MNDTLRSLVAILDQDKPAELKIAVAQVLGELAPQDPSVVRGLAALTTNGQDYLVRPALLALGRIANPAAMAVLIGHLDGRHADLAAHALREIGPTVAAEMEVVFASAPPESRLRMLGILGACKTAKAAAVLEQALLDPSLARRAADVLANEVLEHLDARSQKALLGRLNKALDGDVSLETRAAALAVLAKLDPAGTRGLLVEHASTGHPTLVRSAAIRALHGIKLTPTQALGLLALVSEPDAQNIAEPAAELLRGFAGWTDKAIPIVRKLLDSPSPNLRRFAIECLRHVSDAEVVKPLLAILHQSNGELATAASEALAHNPSAREPMLRAFLAEREVHAATRMLTPLARLMHDVDDKALESLVERGTKALIAQDAQGERVLELVVRAAPERGAKLIVERATKLRRQKKFTEAVALLAFLAHARRLDGEGRFQLAVTKLLIDEARPRGEDDRAGDATMGHFTILVREGFPVLTRLCEESALSPEALLRIGQHFTASVSEERRFGLELLQHLAQKFGKRRAGEEAKVTLRAEGY
ncbi:MAG: HEAT repeat domain-containing protein [Planctomycetota bacterium]